MSGPGPHGVSRRSGCGPYPVTVCAITLHFVTISAGVALITAAAPLLIAAVCIGAHQEARHKLIGPAYASAARQAPGLHVRKSANDNAAGHQTFAEAAPALERRSRERVAIR